MDAAKIRVEVEAFQARTAYGMAIEDCFPAWYLHRRFELADSQAVNQCSDPALDGPTKGQDFGLDAYHLGKYEGRLRLSLIQAKFSSNIAAVRNGFRDLKKLPKILQRMFEGGESDELRENKVIINLRRDINKLSPEERGELALDFIVLHLCQEDHEHITNTTTGARNELREIIEDILPNRTSSLGHIGPEKMNFHGVETVAPVPWISMTMKSTEAVSNYNGNTVQMYYGIGLLSELVDMYTSRRDSLFSKNVRYFLRTSRNTERGPAGRIRETLGQMCTTKSLEPELFAFYHNGVTIFARAVRRNGEQLEVQEPFVLNGCQTIKSAYRFSQERKIKNEQLTRDRWKRITIPVRITTTRDEELVRIITVNNNRQNSITPAALRANDPIQLKLEDKFRRRRLFYERQEGALAQITDTNPEILYEEYENSNDSAIYITDLARSIAASQGVNGLNYATHPNEIFENNNIYNRIFNEHTLQSITFLTFLQNLHDIIFLVLKKDLSLEKQSTEGPSPSRIGYHALALLIRYLAKNKRTEIISRFGHKRLSKKDKDFREEIRKELGNHRSRIQSALKGRLLSAADSKVDTLRQAYEVAERDLKLNREIDPFDIFSNLDETAPLEEQDEAD